MALKDQISELVTPAVTEQGFYLEDVHVATQEVIASSLVSLMVILH